MYFTSHFQFNFVTVMDFYRKLLHSYFLNLSFYSAPGLLREDRRKWREEVAETVPSAEELSKQQAKQLEWLRQAAFLNLANVLSEISDVVSQSFLEGQFLFHFR